MGYYTKYVENPRPNYHENLIIKINLLFKDIKLFESCC